MISKNDLIKDLKFCKELMDRLVKYAEKEYFNKSYPYGSHNSVIQNDIIRLRRELNDVRKKLDWGYDEI